MFWMPTGNFELLMKKKGRGNHKPKWESVMLTDRLTSGDIAECVEHWQKNNKVIAARYDGREVFIPTEYHWEHRIKNEVIGCYSTRAEAIAVMEERRHSNYRKPREERIPVGGVYFVEE